MRPRAAHEYMRGERSEVGEALVGRRARSLARGTPVVVPVLWMDGAVPLVGQTVPWMVHSRTSALAVAAGRAREEADECGAVAIVSPRAADSACAIASIRTVIRGEGLVKGLIAVVEGQGTLEWGFRCESSEDLRQTPAALQATRRRVDLVREGPEMAGRACAVVHMVRPERWTRPAPSAARRLVGRKLPRPGRALAAWRDGEDAWGALQELVGGEDEVMEDARDTAETEWVRELWRGCRSKAPADPADVWRALRYYGLSGGGTKPSAVQELRDALVVARGRAVACRRCGEHLARLERGGERRVRMAPDGGLTYFATPDRAIGVATVDAADVTVAGIDPRQRDHGERVPHLLARMGVVIGRVVPPPTETIFPVLFNTWFPGYAWSIAVCPTCRLHLGWVYTRADADGPASPSAVLVDEQQRLMRFPPPDPAAAPSLPRSFVGLVHSNVRLRPPADDADEADDGGEDGDF
jgi:hypothetical protein